MILHYCLIISGSSSCPLPLESMPPLLVGLVRVSYVVRKHKFVLVLEKTKPVSIAPDLFGFQLVPSGVLMDSVSGQISCSKLAGWRLRLLEFVMLACYRIFSGSGTPRNTNLPTWSDPVALMCCLSVEHHSKLYKSVWEEDTGELRGMFVAEGSGPWVPHGYSSGTTIQGPISSNRLGMA
jgi:hypothetical protein